MTMKKLFVQLNGFDNPMKHWFNGVGWEMVDNMRKQIMKRTKSVIAIRQEFVHETKLTIALFNAFLLIPLK
jgi:hypothetical protein